MRHVDFSPLYRSTVGFDRMFTMLDSLAQPEQVQTYPPYNIESTGENSYRITMAVAGFSESELSIEAREHVLTVKGEKAEIKGASLENGLLHVDLVREIPEAMKPRRIAISAAGPEGGTKQIEAETVN